jgi:hypothetical protein
MKILSSNSVKLCPCNPKNNCPEVILLENGWIQIKDDFGSSVKMTLEEAKEISEALAFLQKESNEK